MSKLATLMRLWAALMLSTVLAGCDAFGFNQTRQVARALLVRPDGKLDDAVASAAVNARFPTGSRFSDLQTFAQSLGGRCGRAQERAWCNIPLHGVICDTRVMSLSFAMRPDDTIEHGEVMEMAKTC